MDRMNLERWLAVIVMLTVLAGCTSTDAMVQDQPTPSPLPPVPEQVSFTAPTLDRDVDRGAAHDLRTSFDGPVLMLWVAAGCSGCHDWTTMLKEELESGNLSNTTQLISVHRYPSFESVEDMAARYGDVNSTHYTPWPLLLPPDNTNVIDAATGRMTDVDLYRGFNQPVTPTLQVLDGTGRLVWSSSTYWANQTVLMEALNIMESSA